MAATHRQSDGFSTWKDQEESYPNIYQLCSKGSCRVQVHWMIPVISNQCIPPKKTQKDEAGTKGFQIKKNPNE
jgi:hypothetical protein